MFRKTVSRRFAAAVRGSSLLSSLAVGLGIWIGFPTTGAHQDIASHIAGIDAAGARWSAVVERSVAGSVHQAEMPFVDGDATGSISGSGLSAPGVGQVAFTAKAAAAATPDESRVNRAEKRGRIVNVAPVAPPKAFNAGSVFDRTSLIVHPSLKDRSEVVMAFDKPAIKGKEVTIAAAFHPRIETRSDPGVPAMLAGLVTSEKADILATAYAPPEPDYAAKSPFATLLGEEDETGGRFIPPVGPKDHAWMREPLPPSVFSAAEQKCLASGVYFEARGESLKGQAAVAQVILNRVRNPTYPGTICGVVYQNDNWRNRCQFSFACDGVRDRVMSPRHWQTARDIAMAVTAGKIFIPEVGSSTHYHATYVHPHWARAMEKVKKIGLHVFYRTYGGGWK